MKETGSMFHTPRTGNSKRPVTQMSLGPRQNTLERVKMTVMTTIINSSLQLIQYRFTQVVLEFKNFKIISVVSAVN